MFILLLSGYKVLFDISLLNRQGDFRLDDGSYGKSREKIEIFWYTNKYMFCFYCPICSHHGTPVLHWNDIKKLLYWSKNIMKYATYQE